MVLPVTYHDAIIFSNILVLASIGLTFTYTVTRVANFAHGALLTLGAYITLTTFKLFKLPLYTSLAFSFIIGAFVGALIYLLIIKPLLARKASIVVLMIATFALDVIFLGLTNIYADYLQQQGIISRDFLFRNDDPVLFTLFGLDFKGVFLASLLLVIAMPSFLYVFLYKTKTGISFRATIENPNLARTMGINVERVYLLSWIISGIFATVAGSLFPLWFGTRTDTGSTLLLPLLFSASIIGGFTSIAGTIIGAYIIGLTQTLFSYFLASSIGGWIIAYNYLLPLALIVITLLFFPSGISGILLERIVKRWSK